MAKETKHIKTILLSLIKTNSKNAVLGIVAVAFVVMATSCVSSGPSESHPRIVRQTQLQKKDTDAVDPSRALLADALAFIEEETTDVETEEYSVEKETYSDEHYDIEFPQIKDAAWLTKETISQINDQIYDFACYWIAVDDEEKPFVTITTRYKITEANSQILSMYFWGYLSNGMHVTNYEFGMTYDMQSGATKNLDAFYENDNIAAAIQTHRFFPTREDDVFWEECSFFEYQHSFEEAIDHANHYFLSDSYIGIIVSVSRPMGDSLLLLCPSDHL